MERLIKGLLAYSRVGTRGKPFERLETEAVLNVALQNLKLALEDNKGKVTHDPLPVIVADESQMVGLFQNLIGNALKFHGQDSPIVHISARRDGREWIFSFKDNGIGIDPQHYAKLFIIFQRLNPRDYPGTGIGLAISKKIVERHEGRIWVDSAPGKGSTFYFSIPDRDESAAIGPIEMSID
jgi:light-regulated signal transduction histidine kinase (bacteriophytochrome)